MEGGEILIFSAFFNPSWHDCRRYHVHFGVFFLPPHSLPKGCPTTGGTSELRRERDRVSQEYSGTTGPWAFVRKRYFRRIFYLKTSPPCTGSAVSLLSFYPIGQPLRPPCRPRGMGALRWALVALMAVGFSAAARDVALPHPPAGRSRP